MTTLNDLLRREFGYSSGDFGPGDGEVLVDTMGGTIRPMTGQGNAAKLDDVFKVGQYVSMEIDRDSDKRLRFVVISLNRDGLEVVTSAGEQGFLPWERLGAALRSSRKVYVNVLSELEDLTEQDRDFVREEIERLRKEISRHRDAAAELASQMELLESVGRRPDIHSPQSWLQGG